MCAKALKSIVDANRTAQWELVRQGHHAWRLSTAELLFFHCGDPADIADFA